MAAVEQADQIEREERNGFSQALAVLRQRDYRLFWGGMSVALVGMWMQELARNWVVVDQLTRSASALGTLNFAGSLPMLLLSLLGGVAADRMDKRRILLITKLIQMTLAFLFAALVASGQIQFWQVLLLGVLGGMAAAYDMPAFQAYYPTLVEKEQLPQAVALSQASFHGSRFVGPALAGLAIGWWGAPSAFIANGLSFVVVIAALILIRHRPAPADPTPGSAASAILDGLQFVRGEPRLRALMALTAVASLFVFPNMVVLLPLYARSQLNVGAEGYSILMSISGLAALVGSVALLAVPPDAQLKRIALGVGGIALGLTIVGLSRSLWLAVAGTILVSLGMSTSMGLVATLVQQCAPDALRGRVMGMHSLMFVGIMPFASLLIPYGAEYLGLAREMQLAAIVYALLGAFFLRRLFCYTAEKESEPAVSPSV
jgi:MFS family permease